MISDDANWKSDKAIVHRMGLRATGSGSQNGALIKARTRRGWHALRCAALLRTVPRGARRALLSRATDRQRHSRSEETTADLLKASAGLPVKTSPCLNGPETKRPRKKWLQRSPCWSSFNKSAWTLLPQITARRWPQSGVGRWRQLSVDIICPRPQCCGKPAALHCCYWSTYGTDRRTDGHPTVT